MSSSSSSSEEEEEEKKRSPSKFVQSEDGWYFMKKGETIGPVKWPGLWEAVGGERGAETAVWRKDFATWKKLGEVLKLPQGDKYHYMDKSGKQKGPVSKWEILNMSFAKHVGRDTPIWKEGLPSWVKVGNLPEFEMVQGAIVDNPERPDPSVDPTTPGDQAKKISANALKCLYGSYVEITDTKHVFKGMNKTAVLAPWPSLGDLSAEEVKKRSGEEYWKEAALEVAEGLSGEVVFAWGGGNCTTRLVKVKTEDKASSFLVPIKVEGLRQLESIAERIPAKKRKISNTPQKNVNGFADAAPSMYQPKAKRRKDAGLGKKVVSGFESWLATQDLTLTEQDKFVI